MDFKLFRFSYDFHTRFVPGFCLLFELLFAFDLSFNKVLSALLGVDNVVQQACIIGVLFLGIVSFVLGEGLSLLSSFVEKVFDKFLGYPFGNNSKEFFKKYDAVRSSDMDLNKRIERTRASYRSSASFYTLLAVGILFHIIYTKATDTVINSLFVYLSLTAFIIFIYGWHRSLQYFKSMVNNNYERLNNDK